MKKHNYVITGISKEQAYLWKADMREDITIYEKGSLVLPVIELTRWAAFKMKVQIIRNNVKQRYGFGLARI